MGLFDKKYCDICKEKIGLLGNRKLEDGNLCKDCAKKLSPWFDERRHSTVEQIKSQLAYREENKKAVEKFHTTRSFGESYSVCIDDEQGKFLVARTSDILSENPDVLDLSQVTSCTFDHSELHTEIQDEDKDGKKVSRNPPEYRYTFNFWVKIGVNHPWFEEMRVPLNRDTVEVFVRTTRGVFFSSSTSDSVYRTYEYKQFEDMAHEIEAALTGARQAPAKAAPAAAESAPVGGWTCTCGAVNKGKFCAECGKPKPAGVPQYKCDKCGWEPDKNAPLPKFCPECGDPFDDGDIV